MGVIGRIEKIGEMQGEGRDIQQGFGEALMGISWGAEGGAKGRGGAAGSGHRFTAGLRGIAALSMQVNSGNIRDKSEAMGRNPGQHRKIAHPLWRGAGIGLIQALDSL